MNITDNSHPRMNLLTLYVPYTYTATCKGTLEVN